MNDLTKELRIGNIILDVGFIPLLGGEKMEVTAEISELIGFDYYEQPNMTFIVKRLSNGDVFETDSIKPLILDRKIMEGCGFYENGIQHLINKWTCINFKKNLNGSYTPIIEDIEFNPIKYYHELQNFWKVLTGEELKKI